MKYFILIKQGNVVKLLFLVSQDFHKTIEPKNQVQYNTIFSTFNVNNDFSKIKSGLKLQLEYFQKKKNKEKCQKYDKNSFF